MHTSERYRKLDVVVSPQTGDVPFETWVAAHPRADGTWEASLEFRSDELTLRTPFETTQPDFDAVVYWAAGLGTAYFDGAFERAMRRRVPSREKHRPLEAPPTPHSRERRLMQLREAERYIMETFQSLGVSALDTRDLFGRSPFSNADLVRAFEELEKQWRYLVRRTEEGSDMIRLTSEGAAAIGRRVESGEAAAMQPPSNRPPQR